MMGVQHRLAGMAAWLVAAPLAGVHGPAPMIAGTLIAGATAHGQEISPDVDQRGLLAKIIPGSHRGITHFWALPVIAYLASLNITDAAYRWEVWAVVAGWGSHLIGDFVFGDLPILPRLSGGWYRAGMGLTTGCWLEKWPVRGVFVAVIVWALLGQPNITVMGGYVHGVVAVVTVTGLR